MKIKIYDLIQNLKNKLLPACSTEHEAEQQATWMLEELINEKYSTILQAEELEISKAKKEKLNDWIEKRVKYKKPIQYIFGHVSFCDLDIILEPPILIPRPETEEWCFWLIEKLKKIKNECIPINILDLGTGTGCIALSLAKVLPTAIVVGVDINEKAIELAERNKRFNNVKNAYFIKSDFYKNLEQGLEDKQLGVKKFDLIVSNPPYITPSDWENLDDVVRKWEDKVALVADDGLAAYKEIILGAKKWLNLDENSKKIKKMNEMHVPRIVLELGIGQENDVKQLLKAQNFTKIEVFRDLSNINRWISAF